MSYAERIARRNRRRLGLLIEIRELLGPYGPLSRTEIRYRILTARGHLQERDADYTALIQETISDMLEWGWAEVMNGEKIELLVSAVPFDPAWGPIAR